MPLNATSAVSRSLIERGDTLIEILAQGSGRLVVLLPSLGRGAEDFEAIAEKLATGFRVLRPQPRGIGLSRGPLSGIDLHDYANDVATVIESAGEGPAFVVGHAFGNRVARLLATVRPDLVSAVAIVAANVGHDPSPPHLRQAMLDSMNTALSEAQRIAALKKVYFAPGSDPRPWLTGWHPEVFAAERVAGDKTSRDEDYAAGHAPVLYLQPAQDPLAGVKNAAEYKNALGDRVTVVVIPNASHAAIEEQPDFVAAQLIAYAKKLAL